MCHGLNVQLKMLLTVIQCYYLLFLIQFTYYFSLPTPVDMGRGGRPAPGVMTPFYDTNRAKKKTRKYLISLEMFGTLEWSKNDLKHRLKHLEEGGANSSKYNCKSVKTLKNCQN